MDSFHYIWLTFSKRGCFISTKDKLPTQVKFAEIQIKNENNFVMDFFEN